MSPLPSCLRHLSDTPIGEVLYIQPSGVDLPAWALHRDARRVILAGAEVRHQRPLRRLAAKHPKVELVDTAVSDRAGRMPWLRFNVSELNGWLEPTAAQTIYPRLRLLDKEEREAEDLPGLVARMGIRRWSGRANLLVLQAPGCELPMLAAIGSDELRVFDWILIRSVGGGLFAGAGATQSLRQHLDERGYCMAAEDSNNPLWPVCLFRFDNSAAERHGLRVQVQKLSQEVAQLLTTQMDLQGQIEALKREKAEIERITRDRQNWLTEQRQRLRDIEHGQQESARRQQLLYEELVRAEAQLDFIKDVALREPVR
jgi:hypothetical protein